MTSAPATVTITVTPVNDAPVVTNPGNQTSAEGATVTLPIVATDADGDPLTYSATGLPLGLTIDAATGVITGTVAFGAAATNNVVVTVSDATLSGTAAFTWTVTDTNRAPVATPQAVTTAEDAPVAVTLAGTDPDGDALTYAVVTPPAHGTLSGTAPNADLHAGGELPRAGRFTFTAHDGTVDERPGHGVDHGDARQRRAGGDEPRDPGERGRDDGDPARSGRWTRTGTR